MKVQEMLDLKTNSKMKQNILHDLICCVQWNSCAMSSVNEQIVPYPVMEKEI